MTRHTGSTVRDVTNIRRTMPLFVAFLGLYPSQRCVTALHVQHNNTSHLSKIAFFLCPKSACGLRLILRATIVRCVILVSFSRFWGFIRHTRAWYSQGKFVSMSVHNIIMRDNALAARHNHSQCVITHWWHDDFVRHDYVATTHSVRVILIMTWWRILCAPWL